MERLKARNERLTAALERRKAECEQLTYTLHRLEADCSGLQRALKYRYKLDTCQLRPGAHSCLSVCGGWGRLVSG